MCVCSKKVPALAALPPPPPRYVARQKFDRCSVDIAWKTDLIFCIIRRRNKIVQYYVVSVKKTGMPGEGWKAKHVRYL